MFKHRASNKTFFTPSPISSPPSRGRGEACLPAGRGEGVFSGIRNGFALIEVLMAVTLTAVISMAIYGSFSSGVRIMKRIANPVFEEDVSVFFEKMTRELENSFLNTDIPFTGDGEQFTLATQFRSHAALGGEQAIGRVTYSYDSRKNSLSRRQEDASQIHEEKEGVVLPVLQHIESLRFHYFGYDGSYSQYLWSDDWDPVLKKNKSPMAVKIELEFDDGETREHLARTIAIPVGE